MKQTRNHSLIDKLLIDVDKSLRSNLATAGTPERASPAREQEETELNEAQKKHIAGLMRINHTGEVCAQALYQGQALTAHDPGVKEAMQQSASEEIDHLAWCEERVHQLGSTTSKLNPLFYGLSFGLGALAGAIGDKISLGFVAATENQVCKHLEEHLRDVPEDDGKTRAILEQMLVDEASHASKALEAGGVEFPRPVKQAMTLLSRVMTASTYRI
jgi:ubiquinone biosynthesis monooxygenase Coq7